VLEIAYQTRPKLYDVFYDKVKPLIRAILCQGVPERIDGDGVVLVPLDEDACAPVARRLSAEAVEAIAVALLHAYKDPAHERRIGEILAEELPRMRSCCLRISARNTASIRAPRPRFVNAVLQPRVGPMWRGWRSG